jgi:hypothetical protein
VINWVSASRAFGSDDRWQSQGQLIDCPACEGD